MVTPTNNFNMPRVQEGYGYSIAPEQEIDVVGSLNNMIKSLDQSSGMDLSDISVQVLGAPEIEMELRNKAATFSEREVECMVHTLLKSKNMGKSVRDRIEFWTDIGAYLHANPPSIITKFAFAKQKNDIEKMIFWDRTFKEIAKGNRTVNNVFQETLRSYAIGTQEQHNLLVNSKHLFTNSEVHFIRLSVLRADRNLPSKYGRYITWVKEGVRRNEPGALYFYGQYMEQSKHPGTALLYYHKAFQGGFKAAKAAYTKLWNQTYEKKALSRTKQ